MYDIKLLEQEWTKYNNKRKKPFIYISLIFMCVLFFTYLFVKSDKKLVSIFDNNISFAFLKDKDEMNLLRNNTFNELMISDNSPMQSIDIIKEYANNINDKPMIEKKKKEKIHLNIIQTSSAQAFKDVKKRFRAEKDPDDSLFLAKSYFEQRKYKKAEYWALQTNKVNDNIDESWLIFIKSKIKLKHKHEALRILKSYLKRSNSSEARSLLKKLKNGL